MERKGQNKQKSYQIKENQSEGRHLNIKDSKNKDDMEYIIENGKLRMEN